MPLKLYHRVNQGLNFTNLETNQSIDIIVREISKGITGAGFEQIDDFGSSKYFNLYVGGKIEDILGVPHFTLHIEEGLENTHDIRPSVQLVYWAPRIIEMTWKQMYPRNVDYFNRAPLLHKFLNAS